MNPRYQWIPVTECTHYQLFFTYFNLDKCIVKRNGQKRVMVGVGQPASSERTPLFPASFIRPSVFGRLEPRIANSRLHCSTDSPRNSVFSLTLSVAFFICLVAITRPFFVLLIWATGSRRVQIQRQTGKRVRRTPVTQRFRGARRATQRLILLGILLGK